ncbi:MAG: YceI family protein [Desulfobacterium sp.]|nr:YceI family protein [Desulfobacterium sp.]
MKRFISVLIVSLFISSPAWGKEWTLDTNHSLVQFGIKHIFSTVSGSFSDFEGRIFFDPENLGKSSFDFTVQVKSIDTGNTKRDNHLRSKDFFEAATWPTMTFKSAKITRGQGNTYVATGTMTLKKTAKTMAIPFVYHGTAPSPFNKKQVVTGFDTEFDLDRLDFGVGNGKFHKMGVVGRGVRVKISIEALDTP